MLVRLLLAIPVGSIPKWEHRLDMFHSSMPGTCEARTRNLVTEASEHTSEGLCRRRVAQKYRSAKEYHEKHLRAYGTADPGIDGHHCSRNFPAEWHQWWHESCWWVLCEMRWVLYTESITLCNIGTLSDRANIFVVWYSNNEQEEVKFERFRRIKLPVVENMEHTYHNEITAH